VEGWLIQMARAIALERRRQQIALPQGAPGGIYSLWNEDALAVRKAIDTLPPDLRRLMNLAYFDGLTSAELARRTGLRPEVVTERCRVAMARVRQALARHRLERWGVAPMVVEARLLSRLEHDDVLAS
jgi:DNA-directed RNA polymerase specialized sigma24 family protein